MLLVMTLVSVFLSRLSCEKILNFNDVWVGKNVIKE